MPIFIWWAPLSSSAPLSEGHHPLDSEWHFLFECRATLPARVVYRAKILDQFSAHFLPWDPSPASLVAHVMRAREFPDLFRIFAVCVSSSFSLRHKAWSRVSLSNLRELFPEHVDG